MATITIAAHTTNSTTQYPGSTCTLRIYSSLTFVALDGSTVMQGTPGSGAFFKSVPCTISSGVITIPLFTLPSTTDALDNPNAKYTAVFFDSRNVKRDVLLADFPLPGVLPSSPTNWGEIRVNKAAKQPLRDTTVYTKPEVNALLAAQSWLSSGDSRLAAIAPISPVPTLSYGALQGVVDQYGRVTSASALQVPIVQLDSTNLMAGGLVVGGDWGFYVEADGYATHSPVVISGDQAAPAYGFNTVLLARQTLADAAQMRYGHPVTVDSAKRHRFGARASTGNGTDQIQLLVTPLDIAGTLLAVSQNFVPPAAGAITGTTGENSFWLNQIGGGAPAFPTGTLAVLPLIAHATAGAGYAVVYDAYLIPDDRLPTTNYTATSIGWGTHEGASSGTDLYVVSHSFATVSRFSTGMVRQAIATTDAYPHDVIVAGGFVWVINYTGATLQRFDLTTLSNAVTYPLLGGFNGFGLAYDGARYLYLGIGDAPNSRIIKFDTTTAVGGTTTGQTLLSTDVNGGAANIPVQYLSGSVWANHYTNGTVKRINPSSGATIATISTSIGGGLYGLGTDGTYIYANGNWGIVKIDPATNTVVATYRFSKGYSGSANLKYDGKGRMWGVAGGGPTIFYLDIRAGVLVETYVPPGGAKWVQPMLGYGVYTGFYSSPYLNRYAP